MHEHTQYTCTYKCGIFPAKGYQDIFYMKTNNKNNIRIKYRTSIKGPDYSWNPFILWALSQAEFLWKDIQLYVNFLKFVFCHLLIVILESYYCLFLFNMRLVKGEKYAQQPNSLEEAYKVNK